MKRTIIPDGEIKPATLQDVLDRVGQDEGLSATRKRDLRSAVITFAKATNQSPASILLDIPAIRHALDQVAENCTKMSAKRRANLRSDIGAALDISALVPVLKTAKIALTPAWKLLLASQTDHGIRYALSRFARWASGRAVEARDVDRDVIEQFITALETKSLVRNIREQRRSVVHAWNQIADKSLDLRPIAVRAELAAVSSRVPWDTLTPQFRDDVDRYLAWCAMPDPLDDGARVRALAPKTLRLRREQIHSAITSAAGAGADVTEWVSLTELVDLENFKSLLRARWSAEGQKLTAYTHGVAGLLITIASEWAKAPSATITKLKTLRRKLGSLAPGLTDKNKGFLRKFADLRLLQDLVQLPEKLWLKSRRALASSRRPFIDLQSALAIDILLHVPLRMANLTAMRFGEHLQWPQGRGKPALLVFHPDETKNAVQMEFELPTDLANRLWVYRTEIIPTVTGTQSDAVFVSWTGTPRKQETITNAIEKTVLRNLGLKMTPHQFRHLAAQIILDANPGAIEVVRQLMAHKNSKTTMNFYAGINTRRAGRAHADLLISLRESSTMRNKRRIIPR